MAITIGKPDIIPLILQLVDTIYFRGYYSSLNITAHRPLDITAVGITGDRPVKYCGYDGG